jgi:alcohol dehydrogenase, propanol-preferring
MKAVQLVATRPLEREPLALVDVPVPEPGPGQLLMKVTACGVCRSNLHMIEGEWQPACPTFMPIIPGHEVLGRVVATGEGANAFIEGDLVGVMPVWSTCGVCDFCLEGADQLCQAKEITGESVDGGYAEYMLATEPHTYAIPDGLDEVTAAPLLCPGITGYGAVAKAALGPGKSVGVFGVGGVGHLALQFAALTGAECVAISRGSARLDLAADLGAHRIVDSSKEDAGKRLRDEGGLDAALVFAPSDSVVMQALQSLRPGGILVLGVNAKIGAFPFALEQRIVGSLLGDRQMVREVLALAAAGRIRVTAEERPLVDAARALADLKAGKITGRVVLRP